jgi:Zn-dependent peptidase ImmA (M78 family)
VRNDLCRAEAQKTITAFRQSRKSLAPPIPVEDVASWLGFQVVRLSTMPEEFSALVSTREKIIGINGRHHRHRQRFSISHELAHVLLKHPPESRCTSKEIALYNREADECASELLMPQELLLHWYSRTRNLTELCRIFDVSEEAMSRRMEKLKVGTSPIR